MSGSKDNQAKTPKEGSSKPVDFGPIMSLEEAEALRKGRSITMEEFKARFGLQ